MYGQYTCAEIPLPPCICTRFNVLGARTTAGFRCKKKAAHSGGLCYVTYCDYRIFSACAIAVQAREEKVDPEIGEKDGDKTNDGQPGDAAAAPAAGEAGMQC